LFPDFVPLRSLRKLDGRLKGSIVMVFDSRTRQGQVRRKSARAVVEDQFTEPGSCFGSIAQLDALPSEGLI
jgi:hypothetical protein